jgi:hypothetical protein
METSRAREILLRTFLHDVAQQVVRGYERKKGTPMTIKRVGDIYDQHIKTLPAVDQLRLVDMIAHGLVATVGPDGPHSRNLLELEGLGEEIWQGIDPQAYVSELRKKWDQHS